MSNTNTATKENEVKKMIKIEIDGREVEVPEGSTVLDAARKIGINIPTLCYHKDLGLAGACRMCVVEIEGQRNLQTSCTYPASPGLKVKTWSPEIRHARKNILSLLLSEHYGDCTTCIKSSSCELSALSEEYGIDKKIFGEWKLPVHDIIKDSPIVRDMNKCIGCFRCIRTCQELQNVGAIGIKGRSNEVEVVTFMDKPMMDALCVACGQCILRCPTGALTERDDTDDVWKAIEDPTKHVVIQTAPAPRAAIGEEFGLKPGTTVTKQLNTALKRMGFDKVFDTNFTADLTIMEEGTELLLRLKKALVEKKDVALPQITSCSPGWIKFAEQFGNELLQHLSTCKSPQQMFGAIVKTYYAQKAGVDPKNIVSVSLMPCTAKKYECERPEMTDSGYQDVDYVLTTRELARMIKATGLDLPNLPKSDFDDPVGLGSGAGIIFGATGGVMEAAIRTAYEIVTGEEVPFKNLEVEPVRGMEGVRTAEVPVTHAVDDWKFLEGATLKVMIAHGLSNARWVLEQLAEGKLKDYHFIEIMCCPGGCLSGGGQPIPTNLEIREARAKAIYNEDRSMTYRKSHDNPVVKKIYEEFLTEGPCGHKSHELLHTDYTERGNAVC
ncbi:MAG: NADH-dependent [FeFe] hydrogenase, group A6 [Vulcanimicrobiota bacterium]